MTTTHTYNAYLGEIACKQLIVARLRSHADAQHLETKKMAWQAETGAGSPYGLALQSTDESLVVSNLGMPVAVARLQEAVFGGCRVIHWKDSRMAQVVTAASAVHLPLQWFESIAVGADLSKLPSRFAQALLRWLVGGEQAMLTNLDAEVRVLIASLSELHEGAAANIAIPDAQWTATRQHAMQVTDAARNSASQVVATFAEAIAWPDSEASSTLPSAVDALANDLSALVRQSFFSPDEQALRDAAQQAIQRLGTSAAKVTPDDFGKLPEVQAVSSPDWMQRERQALDGAMNTLSQVAQQWHALLIGCLPA